jgi:hypothetical protein
MRENDYQQRQPRLLTWAAMQRGDLVLLHGKGITARARVEDCTEDGSIIWIRDEFNERRLVHINDCHDVRIVEVAAKDSAA